MQTNHAEKTLISVAYAIFSYRRVTVYTLKIKLLSFLQ